MFASVFKFLKCYCGKKTSGAHLHFEEATDRLSVRETLTALPMQWCWNTWGGNRGWHRSYLELSHSLPAPQRPLKPSARLLLQSRAESGRWRHLRPSLATNRKTKCLSFFFFFPQTRLFFYRGWARTSSTAHHSEVLPHPNPSFPSGKSQESVEIFAERSINFHSANSPASGSGRTMKSSCISQRGVDSDRSLQSPVFSPRRLPSVWQLSFVRSNFYGDSGAHSAASLLTRFWTLVTDIDAAGSDVCLEL